MNSISPTPDLTPTERRAALLAATRAANARRLAEAQARAAAIVAEAEAINASFLKLAEEQADLLLRAVPPAAEGAADAASEPRRLPRPQAEPTGSIDGGVDLIAGPFARFSQLASFTRAVRALTGVTSLDTRQFLKGTVHLRLRYANPIPLAVRLAELTEFGPQVVEASPSRIELRVNLPDLAPAVAAEDVEADAA